MCFPCEGKQYRWLQGMTYHVDYECKPILFGLKND